MTGEVLRRRFTPRVGTSSERAEAYIHAAGSESAMAKRVSPADGTSRRYPAVAPPRTPPEINRPSPWADTASENRAPRLRAVRIRRSATARALRTDRNQTVTGPPVLCETAVDGRLSDLAAGHAALLSRAPTRTLRLVFPQPLDRFDDSYQAVVHGRFESGH